MRCSGVVGFVHCHGHGIVVNGNVYRPPNALFNSTGCTASAGEQIHHQLMAKIKGYLVHSQALRRSCISPHTSMISMICSWVR